MKEVTRIVPYCTFLHSHVVYTLASLATFNIGLTRSPTLSRPNPLHPARMRLLHSLCNRRLPIKYNNNDNDPKAQPETKIDPQFEKEAS